MTTRTAPPTPPPNINRADLSLLLVAVGRAEVAGEEGAVGEGAVGEVAIGVGAIGVETLVL